MQFKYSVYYDSLVTRLYIDVKNKNEVQKRFNKLKTLWGNKDVIIIEGKQSRLGLGNDLFSNVKSMKRIICPSTDAYKKYHEIFSQVVKQETTSLILLSLGPTAAVMAYDLNKKGYQALDIGHIDIEYEWYLQKADKKIPVKYKYIGEINGGDAVEEVLEADFEKEIIANLS